MRAKVGSWSHGWRPGESEKVRSCHPVSFLPFTVPGSGPPGPWNLQPSGGAGEGRGAQWEGETGLSQGLTPGGGGHG